MREIKFRGMTSKGWLYGDLIHNRGKVYIAPIGEIYHESVPKDFEVDEIGVYNKAHKWMRIPYLAKVGDTYKPKEEEEKSK